MAAEMVAGPARSKEDTCCGGGGNGRRTHGFGRVAEFELEEVLGEGGFGVTYLARDESLGRRVAVKEYFPSEFASRRRDGAIEPRSRGREEDFRWGLDQFLQEARMLAWFDHPNLVRAHRVFEARGTAYLVTDHIKGRNLAKELEAADQGVWPETRVRALLRLLLDGLAVVHAAGVVHRDLKPGNVMVRTDGMPVLIDFGAAKQAWGEHSRSFRAMLTDGYAAIEQYGSGVQQGPWTDVYALGAIAYRALSGRTPTPAADRAVKDRLAPVATVAPGPVGKRFAAAVMAALAVKGAERPQSVDAWRGLWDGPAGDAQGKKRRRDEPTPPVVPRRSLLVDRAFLVGRDKRCDCVLAHRTVSRRHAEIVLRSDGRLSIKDLDSTGGTFVRVGGAWKRIRSGPVEPTDCLRLGELVIEMAQHLLREPGLRLTAHDYEWPSAVSNEPSARAVKPVRNRVTGEVEESEE